MLVVGLDIGGRTIRAAAVRTGLGPPEVLALEERPLVLGEDGKASTDEIAAAIREVMARLPAGVEAIHTALAGDAVSARLTDVPAAAGRKAEQILAFELEGQLPFDLATSVFHFQPAPGAPLGKIRSLAAVAPASAVEAHLAVCRAAGIDPRVLSAGALPLADLVPPAVRRPRGTPADSAPLLVVDVGHRRTDLVGVLGGRPVFSRTISHGGADLTAAIAAALHVPHERAEALKHAQATVHPPLRPLEGAAPEGTARLAEVVRSALDPLLRDLRQSLAGLTAATGSAPIAVALAGGGSRLAGLSELLEAAMRLPVTPLDPPALRQPIDAERFVLFAKALGLALRAAHKSPRIDLRRGSFAVQADARALRGRVLASAALGLLVVLAWTFSAVSRYVVLKWEAERQTQSLGRITRELLEEEITDFDRAAALAKGGGRAADPMPQMDAFAVLDTLSKRIPSEILHDIDELDVQPDRAELRGLVDSLADVDRVFEAISEEPCFPTVNRGKTTRNTNDGRQKYQLDIEIRCPTGDEDAGPSKAPAPAGGSEGGD